MVDLQSLPMWLDCGGGTPRLDQRMFACSRLESLAVCLAPGSNAVFRSMQGCERGVAGGTGKRGRNGAQTVGNQADRPAQWDFCRITTT